MAAKDPETRRQAAKIAGLTFAATHDTAEFSARGRQGNWERYLREVDPDGVLPEAERTRRAKAARRAEMSRMALRSAQVRRRSKP